MFKRFIRIFLGYTPLLLVFIFIPLPHLSFSLEPLFLIISISLSMLLTLTDVKNIIQMNNRDLFFILPQVKTKNLLSRISETFWIPLLEEMFFRGTIPLNFKLSDPIFIIFLLITIVAFNLSHYLGGRKEMDFHLRLFIFSIISIFLYLWTGNIIYSFIFHIFFNLPMFITSLHMFYIQNLSKEY